MSGDVIKFITSHRKMPVENEMVMDIMSIFSSNFLFLMLIIGYLLIAHDSRKMKQKGKDRDYKIALSFGIGYIILGFSLYIIGEYFV